MPSEVSCYGVVGRGEARTRRFAITDMVEKPKREDAPSNLIISGPLHPAAGDLPLLRQPERGAGGEIQITDAMQPADAESQPLHRREIRRPSFDCGSKIGFLTANVAYALERDELAAELRQELQQMLGESNAQRCSFRPSRNTLAVVVDAGALERIHSWRELALERHLAVELVGERGAERRAVVDRGRSPTYSVEPMPSLSVPISQRAEGVVDLQAGVAAQRAGDADRRSIPRRASSPSAFAVVSPVAAQVSEASAHDALAASRNAGSS